ncbi:hypothetical protein ACJ41O_006975 [Fusarium nematophilum]
MPNTNKGGTKPQTQAAVPTRFRCKVGGEWKALSEFSNSQQRLIQRQIENRQSINAAHSGMSCKEHTAGSRTELRCEVCMRCVAWSETQEPSVVPSPLETGHISVEEESEDAFSRDFIDNASFFDDDDLEQATMAASRNGRSAANTTFSDTSSVAGGARSTTSRLPPHLEEKLSSLSVSTRSVADTSDRQTGDIHRSNFQLPPHLRNTIRTETASETGPPPASGSAAGSVSTATTVRNEQLLAANSRKIPYNAWDSAGNQHRAAKQPTVVSSTASASSIAENSNKDTNLIGDWNMPAPQESQVPEGRGKWPKASEVRIPQAELKKQPVLTHTTARPVDPDVDRQRQLNYCESDDSDF